MNHNKPLISVILPTYNRSGYFLGRAIQSVIDQVYSNWELIIVDNNSTDNTLEFIKTFKDMRIKVYNITNDGNIAKSRNLGIKYSTGAYIAFLDSDDYWEKDKLSMCYQMLETNMYEAVCHGEKWKYHNKTINKSYGPVHNFSSHKLLLRGNCISLSAIIIKRENIINAGCFSIDKKIITAEDYDLWIKLAKDNLKLLFIENILGTFEIHKNSESSNISKNTNATLNVIIKHFNNNKKLNEALSNCWKVSGKNYYKNGSNLNAIKSFIKSLRYNLFDYKLYLYILISIIPYNVLNRS
tara:strand:+ start:140 stop:1030 length:891 start_codon:yes stop_codon:yes gene_type:complete